MKILQQKWVYCIVLILIKHKSSAENKKSINAVQRCSVQNRKGAIASLCTAIAPFWLEGRYRQTLYSISAIVVLNGASLTFINALLALNWGS